jgi:aminopeptidase N
MPMKNDAAPLIRLEDYTVPDHLIDTVDLTIKLHASHTTVRSLLQVRPNPKGRAGVPLLLDGEDLTLKSIAMDGWVLATDAYVVTAHGLQILKPPQGPFSLTIETEIDPGGNSKLMGLYRSNGIYCTQCEADGFRRITYFPDRPDVMSVYTVLVEAERSEAPVLLANGNRVAAGMVEGTGRHFAIWHDPHPKPAYLFAIVGGDLEALRQDYVTAEGRPVELAVWVEPGKVRRAAYALDALVRCMKWDEEVFGRSYDLEVFNVVAVSHFNMGAMENKGLNIFNDKYVLADPETATDQDHANIEAIIAHEYFHNWTGNRITCRDWFQLCLKEGLTVFRDQEFSSDARSRPVKRIADVRTLRSAQFAEDSGPLAHPVRPRAYKEINNFYTPTVYEKGAELIRMLKLLIGEAAFADGMALYFTRCDGTAATIEQFLACFAESSGRDLGHFARWYDQAGTPHLVVSGRHDAQAQTYTLAMAQSTAPTPGQPDKQPMVIPVSFGLVGSKGDVTWSHADGPVHGNVILLEEAAAIVTFHGIRERPAPSLLRQFSAPVRLEIDLADDDLITLFVHDSDPFNRWQSLQSVALRALVRATHACDSGDEPTFPSALMEAIGGFLDERAMADPAFAAQVLALPNEGDVAREIGRDVNPDAILAARKALRMGIGRSQAARLERVYHALKPSGSYSPQAADAGRRSLRHEALGLIMAGDAARGFDLARDQYDHADNLTDRLGALSIMAQEPMPGRESVLEKFGTHYRDEPLVLDKWFALQAMMPEADVLERIRRLMQHPQFDLGNPNRARSLIGGFATGNPTQFNRPDGKGHQFIADMAIALDARNPQTAARILGSFKTWRMLEAKRRMSAEAALRLMSVTPGLSRDAADIIERALA